jgi:hypothetical protein
LQAVLRGGSFIIHPVITGIKMVAHLQNFSP